MKRFSLTIFAFIILTSAVYAQQSVNINEGFEGSWMTSGWQSASFTETATQNHTSGGSKSAVHGISVVSTASITSVKFQVISGEQFDTVSFWLRTSAISLVGSLTVEATGNVTNDNLGTVNLSTLPTNSWVKYSYPYSASANDSVSIKVSISHVLSIGNIYVDDIRINKSVTLPVQMSYFNHSVSTNKVSLNWGTSNEINNSGFEIQRSSGNSSWKTVSFVHGNGTCSDPKDYTFTDAGLNTGKYYYRLKQIDYNGNFEYHAMPEFAEVKSPANFDLEQNFPNPSNPSSKINYRIPEDGFVTLKIYDITGKEVRSLVNAYLSSGYHTAEFDGSGLPSGIYFYKITAGSYTNVKKLILAK